MAELSVVSGDRTTAKAMFQRLGDSFEPSTWDSREIFDNVRKWALQD